MMRAALLPAILAAACSSNEVAAPPPRLLTTGGAPGLGIAVDASHVYWTAEDGVVRRVAKNGGDVETVRSGAALGYGVAVDATNVYWTEWASDRWVIQAQPKAGGDRTVLASVGVLPGSVVIGDGRFVYWNADHAVGDGGTPMFGSVHRVPAQGGAVQDLAVNQRGAQELHLGDDGFLYWAASDANTKRSGPDVIRRVPKDGGAVTDVVRATAVVGALAVAHGQLVWSVLDPAYTFHTCDPSACSPRTAQSDQRYGSVGITDGDAFYWWTYEGLVRVSSNLSRAVVLGAVDAVVIAADESRLYGISFSTGAVRSYSNSPW